MSWNWLSSSVVQMRSSSCAGYAYAPGAAIVAAAHRYSTARRRDSAAAALHLLLRGERAGELQVQLAVPDGRLLAGLVHDLAAGGVEEDVRFDLTFGRPSTSRKRRRLPSISRVGPPPPSP